MYRLPFCTKKLNQKDVSNMTEKLFERDSNLKTCEATVLECEQAPQGFAVVLDRTVLFPEGGGGPMSALH